MPLYLNVKGTTKEITEKYIGVSNVKREVSEQYLNVNGTSKLVFQNRTSELGTITYSILSRNVEFNDSTHPYIYTNYSKAESGVGYAQVVYQFYSNNSPLTVKTGDTFYFDVDITLVDNSSKESSAISGITNVYIKYSTTLLTTLGTGTITNDTSLILIDSCDTSLLTKNGESDDYNFDYTVPSSGNGKYPILYFETELESGIFKVEPSISLEEINVLKTKKS